MSADTLLDLSIEGQLVVMLEDESITPCDYEDCDTPAAWSRRCEHCADVWLYCTPHRHRLEGAVSGMKLPQCAECRGLLTLPLPFLPL